MADSKESEGGDLEEDGGKRGLPTAVAAAAGTAAASSAKRYPVPTVAETGGGAPGLMEEGLGEKRTESMVAKVFIDVIFLS